MNDVLLSGKPTVNKAGNVKFGDVDATKKAKLIKKLRDISKKVCEEFNLI